MRLLITCEHGGNQVPPAYRHLFRRNGPVLQTHRAYDPGALSLAKHFAGVLRAEFHYATVTRLLVELNRSEHHPKLFSEFTRGLAPSVRQALLQQYYRPYRNRVERWIEQATRAGQCVLHVSVHTFTPCLDGRARQADVGFLYDPARELECRCADRWRSDLCARRPDLRVRRNYPYLGKSDGLTTALRKRFPASQYVGLELEVNQTWFGPSCARWRQLSADLVQGLARIDLRKGRCLRRQCGTIRLASV